MRLIKNIIKEKELLQTVTSHKKAVDLALEKAKKIGQGSSRVVFDIIDPEYGNTVIKIAKNRKGLAQNEFELGILRDRFHPDILPELYDYDKDSVMLKKNDGQPLWLQVEKVNKINEKKFNELLKIKPKYLSSFLHSILTPYSKFAQYLLTPEIKEQCNEDEFIQELLALAGNYDLGIGDLTDYHNFGEKDGKLIVIDVGLNKEIYNTFYKR